MDLVLLAIGVMMIGIWGMVPAGAVDTRWLLALGVACVLGGLASLGGLLGGDGDE